MLTVPSIMSITKFFFLQQKYKKLTSDSKYDMDNVNVIILKEIIIFCIVNENLTS